MALRHTLFAALVSFLAGLLVARLNPSPLGGACGGGEEERLREKVKVIEYAASRSRRPVITGPFPVPFVGWGKQW